MSDFQYNCHLNSGFCIFKSNAILIRREISSPMTLFEKFDISSQYPPLPKGQLIWFWNEFTMHTWSNNSSKSL